MITVAIPVYNSEKYLKRSIESVLEQTYIDFELLLIDDGSMDNSSSICKNYEKIDKRVKYIRNEHRGIGYTRYFIVHKAKGEFLFFLDSDDYISKDCLQILFSNINQNIDCVIAQHHRYSNDYKEIKQVVFPIGEFDLTIEKNLMDEVINFPHGVELWNKLYKTNILQSIWEFPIELEFGEDILYYLLYLCNCKKIKCINNISYYYEFRNNSTARTNNDTLILLKYIDYLIKCEKLFNLKNTIYPLVIYLICCNSLQKYFKNNNSNKKNKLIKDLKSLHNNPKMIEYSIIYLKNKKFYNYNLPKEILIGACEFFKSILTGDSWYYLKLYPAKLESSKIILLKTWIKKILGM